MSIGLENLSNVTDSLNVLHLHLVYLLIVMMVQELLIWDRFSVFFSSNSFRSL